MKSVVPVSVITALADFFPNYFATYHSQAQAKSNGTYLLHKKPVLQASFWVHVKGRSRKCKMDTTSETSL